MKLWKELDLRTELWLCLSSLMSHLTGHTNLVRRLITSGGLGDVIIINDKSTIYYILQVEV